MIRDSINLYKNTKYLSVPCNSCDSVNHIISECPDLHITIDPEKVIKAYIEEEREFKRNFLRRYKPRFSPLKNLEQLQEVASEVQLGHQNEGQEDFEFDQDEDQKIGSYSSLDEVLDRKIYDPKPIDYVEDTTHIKFLDVSDTMKHVSVATLIHVPASKKNWEKVGEIETFVRNSYDPFYCNLNLDKVKNFEVYYPNNNITKLAVEFEKIRLEKIVHKRLGKNANHIVSKLLVKGFRMNEKKKSNILSPMGKSQCKNTNQHQEKVKVKGR